VTYEQWDAIADSINPLMAAATLVIPLLLRSSHARGRIGFYVATAGSMALMYLLAWVEGLFQIWSRMGLDFSGHSAFAIVLVVSVFVWHRIAGAVFAAVFVAYAVLMLFQRYHAVADILTTIVVIGPLTALVHWLFFRRQPVTARRISR
jgi:hypothetical protein